MCGITGLWNGSIHDRAALESRIKGMNNAIIHRGPDDEGLWVDAPAGLALAQRRLSIIDLSHAGHQPMISACGRYVMVYNGEIFNAPEMRPALEARGIVFRGYSDTEVMLEACAAYGVEAATKQFIGMFAFALWDRREHTLTLVRDRLGIKPLYWGWAGGDLAFASEIKAFHGLPDFKPPLNRRSLASFVDLGYIPAPHTVFDGIHKLMPGFIAVFRVGERQPNFIRYWDFNAVAQEGLHTPFTHVEEATQAVHDLMRDAIARRMVADVPLGAFLSGGIDSSLVVSIMQSLSSRPIKTFSIGFEEADYNEAHYAKDVAAHLGTEHTELYVNSQKAQDVIPLLQDMYDEPFADSSQIPTYLVSKLAREHVTVSLSGDGGDELFAGYTRYTHGQRIWSTLGRIPGRRLWANTLGMVPQGVLHGLEKMLPAKYKWLRPKDRIAKLQDILSAESPQAFYNSLIGHNQARHLFTDAPWPLVGAHHAPHYRNFVHMAQFNDTLNYLPEDILTKVDRASMAVSLEARVPLLDHRLVAMAWRVPLSMKIQGGKGKHILRQILKTYVPEALFERPKMGFGVPIDQWLRGPLRDWAQDLLDASSLADIMDPAPVQQRWQAHLAGQNHQYSLWPILMLQAWRRRWGY